jgi:hypothetical protein
MELLIFADFGAKIQKITTDSIDSIDYLSFFLHNLCKSAVYLVTLHAKLIKQCQKEE